jgi:hypothetical protein
MFYKIFLLVTKVVIPTVFGVISIIGMAFRYK